MREERVWDAAFGTRRWPGIVDIPALDIAQAAISAAARSAGRAKPAGLPLPPLALSRHRLTRYEGDTLRSWPIGGRGRAVGRAARPLAGQRGTGAAQRDGVGRVWTRSGDRRVAEYTRLPASIHTAHRETERRRETEVNEGGEWWGEAARAHVRTVLSLVDARDQPASDPIHHSRAALSKRSWIVVTSDRPDGTVSPSVTRSRYPNIYIYICAYRYTSRT